jgi:hypothetical protein
MIYLTAIGLTPGGNRWKVMFSFTAGRFKAERELSIPTRQQIKRAQNRSGRFVDFNYAQTLYMPYLSDIL